MTLTLHLPSGDFTIHPRYSGLSFPWLSSAGKLKLSMRTRVTTTLFGTENANVTVVLDNAGNQVSGLIAQPLRVKAELFNSNGTSYFAGLVQSIKLGRTYEMVLEA